MQEVTLTAAWQLIADLSFADLLLFAPVEGGESFRIVGQLRPYTARTLYPADLIGDVVEPGWQPYVERAWREGRRLRSPEPVFIDAEPVRVEAVPVRHEDDVVAVMSVEAADQPDRPTGRLETAYLRAADALLEMVATGWFPFQEGHELISSPRVGDGLVMLDSSGRVEFASPNATSAFRRMGTNALPLGQPVPGRVGVLVAESMSSRRPVPGADRAARARTDDLPPGGDHSRGPPPGQEQPADGGLPAPPAGEAARRPPDGGRRPRGVGPQDRVDRARPRDADRGARGRRRHGRRGPPGRAHARELARAGGR